MPAIPKPMLPDDDGSADAAVSAALDAYAKGHGTQADVVGVLSRARLLVPVVALLTESEVGAGGLTQEKSSEMALPKLIGGDGRAAVLAFTSVEAMRAWRPDARPIQATAPQVCEAALHEDAAAVVVDVAGPVPFVVEGQLLAAMAAITDPAKLAELPGVTVARLAPRRGRWFRKRR